MKRNIKKVFTLKISIHSYDKLFINNFLKFFIYYIEKNYNIKYKIISLPVKRWKYTVLKSPHVNKTARDQFEMRVYNRLIILDGFLTEKKVKNIIQDLRLNNTGVKIKLQWIKH